MLQAASRGPPHRSGGAADEDGAGLEDDGDEGAGELLLGIGELLLGSMLELLGLELLLGIGLEELEGTTELDTETMIELEGDDDSDSEEIDEMMLLGPGEELGIEETGTEMVLVERVEECYLLIVSSHIRHGFITQ